LIPQLMQSSQPQSGIFRRKSGSARQNTSGIERCVERFDHGPQTSVRHLGARGPL
jgi:hypothetical protein